MNSLSHGWMYLQFHQEDTINLLSATKKTWRRKLTVEKDYDILNFMLSSATHNLKFAITLNMNNNFNIF